jgi:DNA-binding HxlR family transcriptional regulator
MARRPASPAPPSAQQFCPVHASIEVLQEKWALHIIRGLLEGGELGFNELRRTVGANPATLSERLARLEDLGVVRRTVLSVMPPKTSYALTPAGVALHGVVDAIAAWGRKYLDETKGRKGTVQVKKAV